MTKMSGTVVAGFPSPAEQYQETPLDLNELLVKHPAATFFVKVQGDSMIDAGINDGDLLVVDRSLRPSTGDVIIACVDGDFTVKTFRRNGGDVRLVAANPNYPDIVMRPGQELDYFGKVTACIHRFHSPGTPRKTPGTSRQAPGTKNQAPGTKNQAP